MADTNALRSKVEYSSLQGQTLGSTKRNFGYLLKLGMRVKHQQKGESY